MREIYETEEEGINGSAADKDRETWKGKRKGNKEGEKGRKMKRNVSGEEMMGKEIRERKSEEEKNF